jgi:ankyrin repeat protein
MSDARSNALRYPCALLCSESRSSNLRLMDYLANLRILIAALLATFPLLACGGTATPATPAPGTAQLLAQVGSADAQTLQAIIAQGVDFNAKDEDGRTALAIAAAENPDLAVIELLVREGASVNARTARGDSPLHYAVRSRSDPEVAKLLIRLGADVNGRGFIEETPIQLAARYNSEAETIRVLLEAGANLNPPPPPELDKGWGGSTTDAEIVRDMIRHRWSSPLHLAAQYNPSVAVMDTLLQAGADVNLIVAGGSPLHAAARHNTNVEIVIALLRARANPRLRDERGQTPLDVASPANRRALFDAMMKTPQ